MDILTFKLCCLIVIALFFGIVDYLHLKKGDNGFISISYNKKENKSKKD